MYKFFLYLISIFTICNIKLWATPDWRDPQWLKLLHFKKTFDGKYVSEVDGEQFFLSKNGKYSPEEELSTLLNSISLFQSDQSKNPFCLFPARIRWLEKQGYKFVPHMAKCDDLNLFRKQLSARSVTVVFSSYYLSNPVSSFGHTFLRLGKTESGNTGSELLDTGVNFSAQTEDASFLDYLLKGFNGGFKGEFHSVPYYNKVHEYNDSERRDLWSYHLNFSQEEVDFLVDHLWELGHTHFDYYFLTENCSYHILGFLEVVRPSLNLTDQTFPLFVAPSETLKVLEKNNLLKSVSFRPSPEKRYDQLKTSLSVESDLIKKVVSNPTIVKQFENLRAAELLDSALAFQELKRRDNNFEKTKISLLLARSKIPVQTKKENLLNFQEDPPHKGHGISRLSLGFTQLEDKIYFSPAFRVAQHDFMDNDASFLSATTLEILDFRGRSNGRSFEFENFSLINVINLQDFQSLDNPLSWSFRIGGQKEIFKKNEIDKYGVSGGIGISKKIKHAIFYTLGNFESAYSPTENSKFRNGLGVDLGVLLNISSEFKLFSSYGIRDYRWNESFLKNEFRLSSKDYGIGVQSTYFLQSDIHRLQLNTFMYF